MNEEEIKTQWLEFREFIIEKHHLLPDYKPNKTSIILWEEWKQNEIPKS